MHVARQQAHTPHTMRRRIMKQCRVVEQRDVVSTLCVRALRSLRPRMTSFYIPMGTDAQRQLPDALVRGQVQGVRAAEQG